MSGPITPEMIDEAEKRVDAVMGPRVAGAPRDPTRKYAVRVAPGDVRGGALARHKVRRFRSNVSPPSARNLARRRRRNSSRRKK